MSGDQEFEDFLRRRRPLFRGDDEHGLEPPPELDRIVLRQARDAIRHERPLRLLDMPRWAAPVAIAATLVLGLSIVLKTGIRAPERVPDVKVESIAQRTDFPAHDPAASAAISAPARPLAPLPELAASDSSSGAVIVDLAPPTGVVAAPAAPPAVARETPAWRRDARTWQARIQRLRASGDNTQADAEQAEFNREYRAYAGAPDR